MFNLINEPRLNPKLQGFDKIDSQGYLNIPSCFVFEKASRQSKVLSEFTYGEPLNIYGRSNDFCFVQSLTDHYCGWIDSKNVQLGLIDNENLAYRTLLQIPVLKKPQLKSMVQTCLAIDSRVIVDDLIGDYYHVPALKGYIHQAHVTSSTTAIAVIETAMTQLNRAYCWGGRGFSGIDCSAFVQLCFRFAGITLPRDSDLQWQYMAGHHQPISLANVQANDLLFVAGHVMLAIDSETLIHATAYHMKVIIEPIEVVLRRINPKELAVYRYTAKSD